MTDEKRFIGLDFPGFLRDEKRITQSSISGSLSLLEFDSVIINPESFLNIYNPEGTYKDVPKLGWEDSRRIVEHFGKLKNQLTDLLSCGKNIYVLVGYTNKCYRYTGETNMLGQPTNINLFDLYSFLPTKVSLEPMRGSSFEVSDCRFKDFFSSVQSYAEYNSVIDVKNGLPFLKIKGSNKVVGTSVSCLNGNIIFLPYANRNFLSYGKEGDSIRQGYFNAIYDLENSLRKKDVVVEYPEWIDNYNILTETADIVRLQELEMERKRLLEQIDSQNSRLNLLRKYKGIFTSTGDQLESVVKDVFEKMSFQIIPTEKGRTDVIAKYGDTDIVMEIKGLTKSAAEKNAAQLEKWASGFIEQNGHSAKPLLIVNAFREIPLEERLEKAFPDQMIKYSESRNHCLITTKQLLCLFIETTENPDCKEDRISELLNTVGLYTRYSNYTDYIKKVK